MKILILGGTGWLGRTIVHTALAHGHQVTGLARGTSGELPPGAQFIGADRNEAHAYDAVKDQYWDAVIDLASQPGHVRRAVATLQPSVHKYLLVSSCSAYADHSTPHADEYAALLPALEGDTMQSVEFYGQAKVACERHVLQAFGSLRTCIARVGLIGGAGDVSDRSGYWPLRFARPASMDGRVLVPQSPMLSTQLIDVRDLAEWLVICATQEIVGAFNAVGVSTPWPEFIRVAGNVAGYTGGMVPAMPEWLIAQGVAPWAGPRSLPMWLPMPSYAGFATRQDGAAVQVGLKRRPLSETLADVLAWELSRSRELARKAGLSDNDEQNLLRLFDETA